MDAETFMRILETARDENGAFPYRAFLDLFMEVRGRAQFATAAEMLDFVKTDFARLVQPGRLDLLDQMTRTRVRFISRALREYALQAWKLGPAESDPAALPVEDTLFRTVH